MMRHAAFLAGVSWLACLAVANASDTPDSLQACAKEADDARRLACYDGIMALREKSYGLTQQQKLKLDPPRAAPAAASQTASEVISSTVVSVTTRADGRKSVVLGNGQTWVQGEAFDTVALNAGDTVTIKPGLLGSFYMVLPSKVRTRVTRSH